VRFGYEAGGGQVGGDSYRPNSAALGTQWAEATGKTWPLASANCAWAAKSMEAVGPCEGE
jgi:hypothetical protein